MKKQTVLGLIVLIAASFTRAQENGPPRNGVILKRTNDGGFPSSNIKPIVLPDGRIVVSVADTVYMLAPNGGVLWKYATAGETLTSEPTYSPELNEIALVGNDLLFVRLDATTGKLKWRATTNGRAGFSSVTAYGEGYLVVVDMNGYRKNGPDKSKLRSPDLLEYWESREGHFWKIDFPVGAELIVDGKRIYSLNRGKGKVRLRELQVPVVQEKQP